MALADGIASMAFIRVTLIGKTGCGKSSLVNAFVNNVFYQNYQPTDDLTLSYASVRIAGSDDEPNFNCLLEIEDSYGSDKSSDEKMERLYSHAWPPPRKGEDLDEKGIHRSGTAPLSKCRPPELAQEGDTPDPEGQRYRPLTRNRMAYLIVFDSNEQKSYLEACKQLKLLREYREKKGIRLLPLIFLVANKVDKDPTTEEFAQVTQSASAESRFKSIPYAEVSALQYKGVKKLFRNVVSAARTRENLWLMVLDKKPGEDLDSHGDRCSVQ